MEKLLFRSTNRNAELVSFKDALLKGQAPDYGLYMPTTIPKLTKEEIESFKNKEYWEIAFEICRKFLGDEINEEQLKKIVKDSYNFDIPLKKIEDNLYLMYLDEGPTVSFKDFGARLMARMMHYFADKEKRKLTVLVATSGDTGGAVADAFYNLKNIEVIILFPEKEVSEMQRKQITTLGNNVKAFAVKGTFDDCQAIVKQAFNDNELKELNLTSANSINFGRLMPQMIYYIYAYSRLSNDKEKITFSVPSGNFGDLMGGIFAKEMGIPIERFIVAVNENDEFPIFLKTGRYIPVVPSKSCSSNAMNVGHPSNLARLVDIYGGWLADERNSENKIIKKGVLNKKPDMEKLKKDMVSFSISNKEVDETIKSVYKKYEIIVEPHSAVGIAAAKKAKPEKLTVCIQTVDPAKFPEKIREILNIEPEVPESMRMLNNKKEEFEIIKNNYDSFKKKIKDINR
jgi:threonine synthase